MNKIVFVILHYNNIDDTINCINSINRLKDDKIMKKIIIVDNCSPNKTGEKLNKLYKGKDYINVILLDKNYGFSYGNNIGYKYALKEKPDTIVVSNNDILFEDSDFLIKYYNLKNENNNFDIMSPDIINLNDRHQNPLSLELTTIGKARKNVFVNTCYSILLSIPILNRLIFKYKQNHEKKWFDDYYKNRDGMSFNKNDFIPFGAIIIFSNNWIRNETIAFPSNTFMYQEEEILYSYIKKNKYRLLFYDKMVVRHLEGRSTNSINNEKIKVARFQAKTKAKSLKEYIRVIKEMR